MSCFRPLSGYQDPASGAVEIGGSPKARALWRPLELACGRCVGCRGDRSRAWSIRIGHEAQLWDSNLFLTMDYAPAKLPASRSLEYSDFQSFMRSLRKKVKGVNPGPNGNHPVRFFVAGEYGARFQRPHWHAILFNCDFKDKVRYQNGTYRSSMAEDLWDRGRVVIGSVNMRSAAYVAGYTQSKMYGARARDFYEDVLDLRTGELTSRRPEFAEMSNRPGIGAWWYERYGGDLFPHDFAVQEGRKHKVPRYYVERWKRTASDRELEEFLERRYQRAAVVPASESSPERRAVREEVAKARVKMFAERDF